MATFRYKAKDKKGKIVEGVLVGSSEKEIASQLKSQSLSVLVVEKIGKEKVSKLFQKGVTLLDKANLCRYLATMVEAGLSLVEAVEVIADETDQPKMKEILGDVRSNLHKGQSLSSAFAKHSDVFDEVFITLIEAGEKSGTLGKSFDYLGKQLYNDYELGQKVKSTLAYPAIIILTTGGLGVMMMTFVVPKIAPILLRLHENFPLPVFTVLILRTGLFISKNLLAIGGVFLFFLFVLGVILSRPKGKKLLGEMLSRIPFFGQLLLKLSLARFSRTLSTLLKSGVPIVESLQVSASTLTLAKFKPMGETFSQRISQGTSLSEVMRESKLFPAIMIRMVSTGEKTGQVDKLLMDLAKFYEEEVSNYLKALTSVVEPIMMLIIGVAVGAMVILIIAPIYSFVGSLSKSLSSH